MRSLRNRLILVYLVATALPLAATIWISTALLDRSLAYATTGDLDRLSRTLEDTAREVYRREREALRRDALDRRIEPVRHQDADLRDWPEGVRAFRDSGDVERFVLAGPGGTHLDFMQRTERGVAVYRRDLGALRLEALSAELARTREQVGVLEGRDLRRGFTLTLLVLVGAVWLASFVPLVLIANRVSRPIRQLTAGLSDFAGGDWNRRVASGGDDEVGRAVRAFNDMADQLRQSRDRLVYLTQVSSWQSLARKTAHELKNSLTPIRLTVEEMLARQPAADRAFLEQAAQIVVSEIEALERRVRAFSELAAEPPVAPERLDVNAIVGERLALAGPAFPAVSFESRLEDRGLQAWAGGDLVRSILTNLIRNGAEAAGPRGSVLAVTRAEPGRAVIEIHDSGPGLSTEASASLFEPTITFKKDGMGLGLSIAKKYALLSGGDLTVVPGALGGAGFRVVLPAGPTAAGEGRA